VECHRKALTGQPLGLCGEVAGDAGIEPALDLGGQLENFDSHGGRPLEVPAFGVETRVTPNRGVKGNIGHLADRFQYLSVNIP
jgi:hypothetical protein